MTFGERLTYFRNQSGMTQKSFAELIGITPTRLNYYEKDKRQPDVDMIRRLSDGLGITADELLGLETKNSPAPEGTEEREREIDSLESELRGLLVKFGLIDSPDGDLTADQLDFLFHVISLLKAYFKK